MRGERGRELSEGQGAGQDRRQGAGDRSRPRRGGAGAAARFGEAGECRHQAAGEGEEERVDGQDVAHAQVQGEDRVDGEPQGGGKPEPEIVAPTRRPPDEGEPGERQAAGHGGEAGDRGLHRQRHQEVLRQAPVPKGPRQVGQGAGIVLAVEVAEVVEVADETSRAEVERREDQRGDRQGGAPARQALAPDGAAREAEGAELGESQGRQEDQAAELGAQREAESQARSETGGRARRGAAGGRGRRRRAARPPREVEAPHDAGGDRGVHGHQAAVGEDGG